MSSDRCRAFSQLCRFLVGWPSEVEDHVECRVCLLASLLFAIMVKAFLFVYMKLGERKQLSSWIGGGGPTKDLPR